MKTTKKRKKKVSRQSAKSNAELKSVSVSDSSAGQKDKSAKKDVRLMNSKRGTDKKTVEKGGISKYINITSQFLRECKVELKKVKWPTRKELMAATAMVIILVLIIAFYLGVIDRILVEIIKRVVG
jgi:preprotein translocase subunit SecE